MAENSRSGGIVSSSVCCSCFQARDSHQLKANYIYDLPFGSGKRFLSTGNVFKRKAAEGWEFAGVMRVQSGLPFFSQSFGTFLCHQHYRADDRHYHGRQRRGAAQYDPERTLEHGQHPQDHGSGRKGYRLLPAGFADAKHAGRRR